jgi:peroxiredoxin Q/BCP
MTAAEGAIMQKHYAYWGDLIAGRQVVAYGPVMDPNGVASMYAAMPFYSKSEHAHRPAWTEGRRRHQMKNSTRALLCALLVGGALALSFDPLVASAGPPEIGANAPDFSLMTNEGKLAGLSDYRGKWVVLYFYPKDFSTGCTLEAANFELDLVKYQRMNAVILGISVDSVESHKSFCVQESLSFKLLSDPDASVSEQYGSVVEYGGAKIAARNTFIIDPNGKVAKVFMKVQPAVHSTEVLQALSELYGR